MSLISAAPIHRVAPAITTRATATPRFGRRWGARRFVSPLAIVLLWQAASSLGVISPRILAAPVTIFETAWTMASSGELFTNMLVSLERVALGIAAGVSLGVALALVSGLSRLGEDLVDAPMQMLRTLPFLALVPLFILWFGIGELPKVALVALGSMFPVYLNVFAGIRGIDPKLIEAGRVFGLGRWGMIRTIVLPGALPSALVGLRYALGVAWLSLVVAEQINATAGVGFLINDARDFLRTDVIVVCLMVYAMLGLSADGLVRFAERRMLAWRAHGGPVMIGVRIRNLVRQFGDRPVLDGLDLDLPAGEFVALLGRSGSGKTTLLRTLAGLDPTLAGALVEVPRPVSVVFQEPRLLPWRKAWENVTLGLAGVDGRSRAEAALQEVGLGHRLDAWPATLSGGEAQRAALARALVRRPGLLLLDEPFAALDALTRMRMHRLVVDLWHAHAPTTLIVTHDVDEALLLADRVLVLESGRIATDLPVRLDRPRDPAAFGALRTELLRALGVEHSPGRLLEAAC